MHARTTTANKTSNDITRVGVVAIRGSCQALVAHNRVIEVNVFACRERISETFAHDGQVNDDVT